MGKFAIILIIKGYNSREVAMATGQGFVDALTEVVDPHHNGITCDVSEVYTVEGPEGKSEVFFVDRDGLVGAAQHFMRRK